MSETTDAVYAFLDRLGIAYSRASHAPAFTMADCVAVDRQLGALTVKNLFLTPKNGRRFYLCVTRPNARFRTSEVSRQVPSPRLSFAPEQALFEKLRCHGGSASPMGLIFPEAAGVGLVVDGALREVPVVAFHPCDNTATVIFLQEDFFRRVVPALAHEPIWLDVPWPVMGGGEAHG